MLQRVSITSVLTGILLLSFVMVSWALVVQLSGQTSVVSNSGQPSGVTSTNPYGSVPTLNTSVKWKTQTYYIQDSQNGSQLKAGSPLGTATILGKQVPVSSVAGMSASKEILVAWGAYYYLAAVK